MLRLTANQQVIIAGVWGCAWAAFLQWTSLGRWLARRRAWAAVVVGVGGDLLILAGGLPRRTWAQVVAVVASSALAIIARSLINEAAEDDGLAARLWEMLNGETR